jgi:N-acetylmuramoyl-L-alanine amidase
MRHFAGILICIAALPIAFAFKTAPAPVQRKGVKTIVVDPGHGGRDPGARGLITTEAKVCLEVGLKLGKAIEERFPGMKILYTRTTDVLAGNKPDRNSANRYRAEFANQSGGDLFIAIHCNSNGRSAGGWYAKRIVDYNYKKVWTGKGKKRKQVTKKVPVYQSYWVENKTRGTETYIWAADRSDEKGNVINAESDDFSGENDSTITMPDFNDPVMKAFQLLYQKKYFEHSRLFADLIEQEFAKTGRESRGVKQRNEKGIWVLQATGMPSVLVETGFITNKEEEKYLDSEEGQNEIVQNIVDALANYIAAREKAPASSGNKNDSDSKTVKSENPAYINREELIKPGSK